MATIAQILMEQGRQEAESRRARAGAWMPLIHTLSNLPRQVMADRAAERDAREGAFDRSQQRAVRGQQLAKGDQDLAAGTRAAAQAEATETQKRQMNELLATPGIIGDDNRFDVAAAQRVATEKGYRDILDDVLAFGQDWNEGVDKGLLTKEQIASTKRANQPQGYTLSPGQTRYAPGGAVEVSVPAEVKPDTRALNQQLKDALGRGDRAEASAIRRAIREAAEAGRDPNAGSRDPLDTTTTWAVDPRDGVTKPMTLAEARKIGAAQPPTADMRNKEAGKRTASRAVAAVRDLGAGIITKVGPAQRIEAITRGAEAIWGTDPEFRTYQDSRMALAGNLAVEQQGSRVSDADVKALWLPMVPDAYRDTAESYKLKWDLIEAMRGMSEPKAGDQPPPSGGGAPTYQDYLRSRGQR